MAVVVGCQIGFQLGYPATLDTRGIRSRGSPTPAARPYRRPCSGWPTVTSGVNAMDLSVFDVVGSPARAVGGKLY